MTAEKKMGKDGSHLPERTPKIRASRTRQRDVREESGADKACQPVATFLEKWHKRMKAHARAKAHE